ncbi:MAG: bifunctional enoyl-CoA hydratase/phosphate acetyltransferase [Candidatus Delongbacteria bacterium]
MPVKKLEEMFEILKSRPKKRMVAVNAIDAHTIEAVNSAVNLGIIEGILIGAKDEIEKICSQKGIDVNKFKIVDESNETKTAEKAVGMINDGEADFIMKGLISTDKYMRAILNKEKGLLPPKAILSHVTVVQVPAYEKLLVVGDVAIIPAPDLKQKTAITNYVIKTAHALDIAEPKVAVIAATEQVSVGMQACVDAAIISKSNERGQIKNAVVDGPLAFDVAIDMESVKIKGLKSKVAGDADCLVFPNIESGNVFFKTCTKFAGGELAALVVGAKCPAVLTSRGDSSKTKTYSIALASLMSN